MARTAMEVFRQSVQPQLEHADPNSIVAIDLDSGDFECDPDDYTAIQRLKLRRPEGSVWIMRCDGSPAARLRTWFKKTDTSVNIVYSVLP